MRRTATGANPDPALLAMLRGGGRAWALRRWLLPRERPPRRQPCLWGRWRSVAPARCRPARAPLHRRTLRPAASQRPAARTGQATQTRRGGPSAAEEGEEGGRDP
eukprot:311118-Alexandrium_andersonii.AAC.1